MIDLDLVPSALGVLLQGLVLTVVLSIICGVLSLIVGLLVALGRRSRIWPLRIFLDGYVQLIRSTPALVQLVYIFYALPFIGIRFNPFVSAVIGLTLNVSAYLAEVYRSGIEAVPRGQIEAASALGMRPWTIQRKVVLPQAVRMQIPAIGNYMVSLFKETSLAAMITAQELLFKGQIIGAATYDYFTVYTMVFVLYFVVGYPAIRFVTYLERRGRAGYVRRRRKSAANTTRTDPSAEKVAASPAVTESVPEHDEAGR